MQRPQNGAAAPVSPPATAAEAEFLQTLQQLPGWPAEKKPEADLLKLRGWLSLYPGRLSLAELSTMQSWLASNPRRSGNYLFVENWLRKPARPQEVTTNATPAHRTGPADRIPGRKAWTDAELAESWTAART